jgi:hypothetical protein
MATTTIALTQPAYERLKKQKLPGESFSDVARASDSSGGLGRPGKHQFASDQRAAKDCAANF